MLFNSACPIQSVHGLQREPLLSNAVLNWPSPQIKHTRSCTISSRQKMEAHLHGLKHVKFVSTKPSSKHTFYHCIRASTLWDQQCSTSPGVSISGVTNAGVTKFYRWSHIITTDVVCTVTCFATVGNSLRQGSSICFELIVTCQNNHAMPANGITSGALPGKEVSTGIVSKVACRLG